MVTFQAVLQSTKNFFLEGEMLSKMLLMTFVKKIR